ncbi:MAG: 30S ribosomal protein S9 [Candidatus Shapirobacteria bacterium]
MVTKSNKKYTSAIGRRKSAIATIKLFSGKEVSTVNKKNIDLYFPTTYTFLNKPFEETKTTGKYYFESKIVGGGKEGQREALTLAIARALQKIDADFTLVLRLAGLLTVDSRIRERRMVGTGGKARRKKQSPKR